MDWRYICYDLGNIKYKIISKSSGPSLPAPYGEYGHKMVSNGDDLYYINTYNNIVLQLLCEESLEDCHWNTLSSKLQIPRYYTFATLIPDHLADCD